jgi:hypothetical protein
MSTPRVPAMPCSVCGQTREPVLYRTENLKVVEAVCAQCKESPSRWKANGRRPWYADQYDKDRGAV